ncbi:alpha/beta fold hydrolase [Allobranchiibius huperziae]|uniref:Pimeloyl-ACP methyl ester carboxylesterase n=1 Tax=Allobranchiibius huperziae TaxID=1874116 RepID=A0A853DHU5_9MICO|nr:alpha/beta hydrolase [Allobranchiibius huperziae]NYJ75593.1 pimeloyl-ACP methyl ester carboxylesterase [Allobranchiibius huperziae]
MAMLTLKDGRVLEVRVSGPEDGVPVLYHHGTGGTLPTRNFENAVHERGSKLITLSRAGYADSTRLAGRAVVDVVADASEVLQIVGAERFFVAGWSGGGPHALACAARLPGVIGALVISGIAPYDGAGLDFLSGMSRDEVTEWNAALQSEAQLRAIVERSAAALTQPQSKDDAEDVTQNLPPADAAVLAGQFADDLAAANRDGLSSGIDGWVDDELAFTKPWGFDLDEVKVPVSVWHGDQDRNVPFGHGRWVAEQLTDASLTRAPGEGHFSLLAGLVNPMLDGLAALSPDDRHQRRDDA